MAGGKWDPPKYPRSKKYPLSQQTKKSTNSSPDAEENSQRSFRSLKETGMRIGEAWKLKWTDIDFVNSTISVTPEKGSHARMFKISSKLLAMINRDARKSAKIFGTYELRGYRSSFINNEKEQHANFKTHE